MVSNPLTNKIYVLNSSASAPGGTDAVPGFVHDINNSTGAVEASVPVGPFPFGLGIDVANNRIYTGNGSNGTSVRRRHFDHQRRQQHSHECQPVGDPEHQPSIRS